jgi:mono/diheme cytochrome c family protein
MVRSSTLFVIAFAVMTLTASANERQFSLFAPSPLVESGLLKHILPRFSLKTNVPIILVQDGELAQVSFDGNGIPVFDGLGQTWRMQIHVKDHQGVTRFVDWISSEVGQRAITSFQPDGTQAFTLPKPEIKAVREARVDGDAQRGLEVSRQMCARCHVVVASERMNAIGSTPSFFALRSLPNWEDRFSAFFALNPHPSFTQVRDVTPPFHSERPPPIVPLEMTLEDIQAIVAYVATVEPADLGAALEHQ